MAYLQKGYICLFNGSGQVREGGAIHYPLHRFLYEEHHGVVLPRDVLVHHKNGDKLDNHIGNLQATTRAEHPSLHLTHVREGQRLCGRCDEWKEDSEFYSGQKRCKPCSRESRKEWAADNPERIKGYGRKRRKT